MICLILPDFWILSFWKFFSVAIFSLLLLKDLRLFYIKQSTINLPSSPDQMRFQAWLNVSFTQCVLSEALSSDELARQTES